MGFALPPFHMNLTIVEFKEATLLTAMERAGQYESYHSGI